MSKLTLIIGRTGSGKDTLANAFKKFDKKVLQSYTTRPKRNDNDNGHIFISEDEVDNYPDKIATATINEYHYFATREQAEENDIYIINPDAVEELIGNLEGFEVNIIYVSAKDDNMRKDMAINRVSNSEEEKEIFEKRNADEDEQFTKFEERIHSGQKIKGIDKEIVFTNNYSPISVEMFASWAVQRNIV